MQRKQVDKKKDDAEGGEVREKGRGWGGGCSWMTVTDESQS